MNSNCCNKPIKTITSDEGTSYWQCTGCGKGCNPEQPQETSRKLAVDEKQKQGEHVARIVVNNDFALTISEQIKKL